MISKRKGTAFSNIELMAKLIKSLFLSEMKEYV